MSDDFTPFSKSAPEDFKALVSEGVKDAAARVNATVDDDRRPQQPFDFLAKATKEKPLQALAIAFIAGAVFTRWR